MAAIQGKYRQVTMVEVVFVLSRHSVNHDNASGIPESSDEVGAGQPIFYNHVMSDPVKAKEYHDIDSLVNTQPVLKKLWKME